jgi:hypothetical protein
MHRRELVHFSEKHRVSWPILCRVLQIGLILTIPPTWAWFPGPALAAAAAETGEVNALLDAAEAAERRDHLIYPASGSAMSLYHDVLFVDPDNGHAREGLARLAEHFLVQAQAALDAHQLLKADSMVSKARMIYPEYPPVETMATQIALVENAERTRETLDWRLIADRSDKLTPTLMRLGRIAKAGDCRVTINVSSDSEGRWVFQQMNAAAGEHRVRARVKIASPAAVDILCFQQDNDAD